MSPSFPFIDLKPGIRELDSEIKRRMNAVVSHGKFIMGPEVAELEENLVHFSGAKHCITVSSGTEALLISLMALGIGPGDEVITTPFTFIATAEVIVLLGAKPVFVDIEPDTANIDASKVEDLITEHTKAIIPVSLYGQVADMDEINAIGRAHGIPVIEDSAQSFGAVYQGKRSGNLSTISCTSFFPSKPLGCFGDGGAIFTSDDEIAQACREIRVHGQSKRYHHTRVGVGGRMDTLQCAVVLAKLERFPRELEAREVIGQRYNKSLDEMGQPRIRQRSDRNSVFAQYTILCADRDHTKAALEAEGVPTAVHYPIPLNRQPAYKHLCCADCTPVSEKLAGEVLSLPMGPDLAPEHQEKVLDVLEKHSVACAS